MNGSLQDWMLGVLVTLLLAWPSASDGKLQAGGGTTKCEYYSRQECLNSSEHCTPTVKDCTNMSFITPHTHTLCLTSWLYLDDGTPEVLMKDCWINEMRCYGKRKCVDTRTDTTIFVCCCDGDLCNSEFYHIPQLVQGDDGGGGQGSGDSGENRSVRRADQNQLANVLLYSLVPIAGFVCVVVLVFFMWRQHKRYVGGGGMHSQLPTVEPSLGQSVESSLNLQLLELRARGRYGSIWKAQMLDKQVAVKIFPQQDKQSWKVELDMYNLPCMKHDNILRFIGSDRKEHPHGNELWLVTEFHEMGSLGDYLKSHTVTWSQLCRIGESMTCGLAYLHDESAATYSHPAKPAIAHRDLKSKNILLKSDLTACIADFGLALMLESGKAFNETHPQVGTRRYMAPEVLEGAICFNRDSFLRIDMYACGLIIWELMSRCSVQGPVEEYRLPFEAEAGLQPTLEEMQTLVVTQKCRPAIHHLWWTHAGLSNLISTVEECWDQDAEARLSAGCVQERIAHLARTVNSGDGDVLPDYPLSQQQQQQHVTESELSSTALLPPVTSSVPSPSLLIMPNASPAASEGDHSYLGNSC